MLAFLAALVYFIPWYISSCKTNTLAQSAENGRAYSVNDGWGNPIALDVETHDECVIYTATSNGRDEIRGTNDDIVFVQTEWNKSQIAGKWVAVKGKEAAKGFIKGLIE